MSDDLKATILTALIVTLIWVGVIVAAQTELLP